MLSKKVVFYRLKETNQTYEEVIKKMYEQYNERDQITIKKRVPTNYSDELIQLFFKETNLETSFRVLRA